MDTTILLIPAALVVLAIITALVVVVLRLLSRWIEPDEDES